MLRGPLTASRVQLPAAPSGPRPWWLAARSAGCDTAEQGIGMGMGTDRNTEQLDGGGAYCVWWTTESHPAPEDRPRNSPASEARPARPVTHAREVIFRS